MGHTAGKLHTVCISLCFDMFCNWQMLPISFRFTSLALWQYNDCLSINGCTLKTMCKQTNNGAGTIENYSYSPVETKK